MWSLSSFSASGATQAYACDGLPLCNAARSTGLLRIVVAPIGYLDIVATNHHEGGLIYTQLEIAGESMIFGVNDSFALSITEAGEFTLISAHGNTLAGNVSALPALEGATINAFRSMMEPLKIIPYENPPGVHTKTTAEITALGNTYFPGSPYAFDLAMAIYDWTSSNFIRQDLFHQLQYTGVAGTPLDLDTMAGVIFGCNYPGYTHTDANFMHQFLMQPATSETDVYNQLLDVYEQIKPLAIAEMKVYSAGVLSLAPPTVADYPLLYRGAMSMSGGYDTGDFAPSMFEFPGNAGPTTDPLYQAFSEALEGCLKPGSIVTTKGPWSFSNNKAGAEVWQNGILITLSPPEGAKVWPGCANITEFSINPGTFEIDMPPPTRYRIEGFDWIKLPNKDGVMMDVCHFQMTLLGYCVEPMV
ncbi:MULTISPECIES: hypothetical protein [unclassified Lentimonas]|uniref:hypothetical protein n=1 Tax=unclassified Lentimonas TaxID=2630993 RepID=UPI00132AA2B1|nr:MULTISPECIES: hypothetical protein [unclassified Lentimonas]CAA6693546.1 Unannotated [Lentimonas sp. CC19]CAA6695873.1 Unannotated [Lentimonas sp. CC10]CAA7069792.1 Unannotated [Lentimonas sp. CC11]